jgi:hypothetical protein
VTATGDRLLLLLFSPNTAPEQALERRVQLYMKVGRLFNLLIASNLKKF